MILGSRIVSSLKSQRRSGNTGLPLRLFSGTRSSRVAECSSEPEPSSATEQLCGLHIRSLLHGLEIPHSQGCCAEEASSHTHRELRKVPGKCLKHVLTILEECWSLLVHWWVIWNFMVRDTVESEDQKEVIVGTGMNNSLCL